METLPREIIELILSACDAKVLAIQIPQVSKLFKKLSEDNGSIWKAKCEQKYSSLNSKPLDRTWKQFYFDTSIKLFPFFGGTVTKTTKQELLTNKGATADRSGSLEYVTYNEHNFWLKNGVFEALYLTYTVKLPDHWIAQGISFDPSWNEIKDLLKKKIGNYRVTEKPHESEFSGRMCFTAAISAVNKEGEGVDAIYYKLEFTFAYTPGTETTKNTLYKIQVLSDAKSTLKFLYEGRKCVEKP